MKKCKFIKKLMVNQEQRYRLSAILGFVFALLIPILGWIPILLLGAINFYISYLEKKAYPVRFIYATFAAIFILLLLVNIGLLIYYL